MNVREFRNALDAATDGGRPVRFWLRDDDATVPTPQLETLLAMTGRHAVPVTLAVIPARTDRVLADRLSAEAGVTVAVHGWAHRNHAGPDGKKQELGLHRPLATVLDELARGLRHLQGLHGPRCAALLVPPWNRIDAGVVQGLPGLGYAALSVFGPEKSGPLPELNTHVDLIDWRGTGRAKDAGTLLAEIAALLDRAAPIGLLTHHLIHDAAAWAALDRVLALTSDRGGAIWAGLPTLLPDSQNTSISIS